MKNKYIHMYIHTLIHSYTYPGHSEFTIGGVLKDWSVLDKLHEAITVPTLVLVGEVYIYTRYYYGNKRFLCFIFVV